MCHTPPTPSQLARQGSNLDPRSQSPLSYRLDDRRNDDAKQARIMQTHNNSTEKNTVNATSTSVATLSRATGDTPETLVGIEPTCADLQSAPSTTRAQRQREKQRHTHT